METNIKERRKKNTFFSGCRLRQSTEHFIEEKLCENVFENYIFCAGYDFYLSCILFMQIDCNALSKCSKVKINIFFFRYSRVKQQIQYSCPVFQYASFDASHDYNLMQNILNFTYCRGCLTLKSDCTKTMQTKHVLMSITMP